MLDFSTELEVIKNYPDLVQLEEQLIEDQQEHTTRVQVRALESGLIPLRQ